MKKPADGTPPLAIAMSYGGMDAILFSVAVTVLIVVIIVALIIFLPAGGSTSVRGIVGVPAIGLAALLRRRLQAGLLIATANGLEFTEFDIRMRQPKPETTVLARGPR